MFTRFLLALVISAGTLVSPAFAASDEFPLCRKKLQLMLSQNVLHLRGEVVEESLIYRIWMDGERWGNLGKEGQNKIVSMIRCSVTEGRNDRPFSLTVRAAYSNAIIAFYEDDQSVPVE